MDTVTLMVGPAVDAVVAPGDRHPSADRRKVLCECRGCGAVLARYTGALRLTMARTKYRGVEVRYVDGMFVFDCQRCRTPAKAWAEDRLAVELRRAWDERHRRFIVT